MKHLPSESLNRVGRAGQVVSREWEGEGDGGEGEREAVSWGEYLKERRGMKLKLGENVAKERGVLQYREKNTSGS